MKPLLEITSTPISIEISVTRASSISIMRLTIWI